MRGGCRSTTFAGRGGLPRRSRDANEAANFLPRRSNTSCHPGGCLCRIGHFKGSSVFAKALSARAVCLENGCFSERSGSGPSYERLENCQWTSVQPVSLCLAWVHRPRTSRFASLLPCFSRSASIPASDRSIVCECFQSRRDT